jgi:hypothetical protein
MKRFLGLALCTLFLTACDDGDIAVDTIDFSEVEANDCGNIIYKINGSEALFFQLGEAGAFESAFVNVPTTPGNPRVYQVTDLNRIFYRAYDGAVAPDNFCSPIPPTTPTVTEQWTVSSGRIEIETEPVVILNDNPALPGGEKIQKYRHGITFRDITWEKPSGQQFHDSLAFGTYDTFPNGALFAFNFDGELSQCPASNVLYNYFGREGIAFSIDPALIVNAATPIGEPRVGYLAENTLFYRLYDANDSTLLTEGNFCGDAATPAVVELWTALPGDPTAMTGRIEVTTSNSGPGTYIHEIRLKNVYLSNGTTQILLASDYLLGQLLTVD